MTTLASAQAKLGDHPDDAFPNTLEPFARWEYLKLAPYQLSQLELNALQNHRFTGKGLQFDTRHRCAFIIVFFSIYHVV